MAYQLTILPRITWPKEGELFSSWLFRLATHNLTKAHTFCRFHIPGQNIWNRDIDRLVSDVTLNRLSLLTEIPFQTLYQLTLRSYEREVFQHCITNSKQKWVLPLGVYHRTWKNNGLQYCPQCLSNDDEPYFRKSWRLGLFVACIKCRTLLHDCCPACNSPITFFRSDIGFKTFITRNEITTCSKCGFDIRNSPRYPLVIGTIGFQTKLNTTIRTRRWHGHPSYEYFDALYHILKFLRSTSKWFRSFNSLIESYENLRVQLSQERDFEKISTVDREHLLRIGCWVLEGWPNRFVDLCKESKLTTSIVLKDSLVLPSWFISEANQHLHLPSASEISVFRAKNK
jgi:hypothetical protein